MYDDIVYILKNKAPVIEPDINVWKHWYASKTKERIVNRAVLDNGVTILTIFLCDDLSRRKGRPEFFGTSIWRGGMSVPVGYWETWEEAATGHNCFVDIAREWDFRNERVDDNTK